MCGFWNQLGLGLNTGFAIYELCDVMHVLNHSELQFLYPGKEGDKIYL